MTSPDPVADQLVRLGFSSYEARTYVGLLTTGPATGYAVSGATGVPQPKVYETLRRLHDRGAVLALPGQPARWSAIAPDALLEGLESDFTGRLDAARTGLAEIAGPVSEGDPQLVWHRADRADVLADTRRLLRGASRHVYLSGHGDLLGELAADVEEAQRRGVELTVLHFGALPFELSHGRSFRHATTDAVLRPSVRSRHLAAVADSRQTVWALARDGQAWQGLRADDPLLAAVVKGYIRHDVFVQRMHAALPAELEERFGPGLLALADLSSAEETTAPDRSGASDGARTA